MTKAQAEAILLLNTIQEIGHLVALEDEEFKRECVAQLDRDFQTPHDKFIYYQGLIQGMKKMGFVSRLEEARKILKEED